MDAYPFLQTGCVLQGMNDRYLGIGPGGTPLLSTPHPAHDYAMKVVGAPRAQQSTSPPTLPRGAALASLLRVKQYGPPPPVVVSACPPSEIPRTTSRPAYITSGEGTPFPSLPARNKIPTFK